MVVTLHFLASNLSAFYLFLILPIFDLVNLLNFCHSSAYNVVSCW